MSSGFDEVLATVAGDTFEKLAFMLCMPAEAGEEPSGRWTTARVSFSGPFCGVLVLMVSEHLLSALAANMLGSEDESEPSETEQQDALGELLNITCGNLLPEIAGREEIFNVGAPAVAAEPGGAEVDPGYSPVGRARLAVEDGHADIALFIEGGIPEALGEKTLSEARETP